MMIGSSYHWNSLRRGAARLVLCAGAAALALALAAPLAMAQQEGQAQPKSTQAPKTAPAAGAPAAAPGAPAGAPGAGAAAEDAWVKLCMKNEQTQNKEICLINHEGLDPNSGMVLITAMVRKVEGEEKQQLFIRLPTAYALVIPAGVQAKIDENKPIAAIHDLLPGELPGADRSDPGNVRRHAQGQADGRRGGELPAEDDGLSGAVERIQQGL